MIILSRSNRLDALSYDGGDALKDESYVSREKEKYLDEVRQIVEEIKYGSVTLIIQGGKVIQIDKTEKIRINK